MCQRALLVTAIIVLVVGPSNQRASQTFADTRSPLKNPNASKTTRSSPNIVPLLLQLDDSATYSLTNAESTEEQQGYTYNSYYAPSTVNFHDIYSNNLAMLADDPILTTGKDDKEDDTFHLNNIPTKFVEFHPVKPVTTRPPMTAPPPKYIMISSEINSEAVESSTTTTSTTTTTTEEPEESSIRVIPIKKEYQRGVLDLLFPAARVKTFKSVFDTFRRILSHTF